MALPNLNQAKLDSDKLKALAALANFKARRKQSEFVFLTLQRASSRLAVWPSAGWRSAPLPSG